MPNPSPSSPSTASPVWVVYDLSQPCRAALLAKDEAELKALGAVVFTAGAKSPQAQAFLDGVEIEAEWLKQDRWRSILQALRTELASAVDGEVFLRAARRAVWLAARAQTSAAPTVIVGTGIAESLVAWLTGKLLSVPFIASFDDDTRWEKKLIEQLKTEARSVRQTTLSAALSPSA